MKSKAHFKGHPLHPMLIPFPFAFLSGAVLFDLGAKLFDAAALGRTASHLLAAGVVTALLAAVPGFVDYLWTVPPKSSGKQRATRHMIVNLTAVVLFAASWLLRQDAPEAPGAAVLGLELAGFALLGMGGWMGGTLAYRNQIGINHRYANAGKWRDERVEATPGKPVTVARADELGVDQMKLLRVGGQRIVLARTADGWAAFDDSCTHRGGSLAGGMMICGTVQCPWHGSQFDVTNGKVKAGPADQPIRTYRVEERGGEVQLLL
jgi:nitrite reductase/ring-hydroxylating ferredoxin subunit/uncharacterized membrane protein